MEIKKSIAVFFLTFSLINSRSLSDVGTYHMTIPRQNEPSNQEPQKMTPTLSRVKRQFGYEYGEPYYGRPWRPYPLPILTGGGGFIVGRGFGHPDGRGFGGRGFGGRGFGGRGIGGRGGFGGGRGGIGGGRGGRG